MPAFFAKKTPELDPPQLPALNAGRQAPSKNFPYRSQEFPLRFPFLQKDHPLHSTRRTKNIQPADYSFPSTAPFSLVKVST
jgi:hypothetical protein